MSTRIVRWNPADRVRPWMASPRSFGWTAPNWDSRVAMPLDIEENEENFVVKASVPGLAPEDIKIEVEDGVLTIRAEHTSEEEQEGESWHLRERYAGTVERRLQLGKHIDGETINAELEFGVLTLTLAKVEEAKPRLIEVKAA